MGEDDAPDDEQASLILYPPSMPDREHAIELIKSVSKGALKREARIAMRTIDAVRDRRTTVSETDLRRMADAAQRIRDRTEKLEADAQEVLKWLRRQHAEIGLVSLAQRLSEDQSNLSKMVLGRRGPSKATVEKVSRMLFGHYSTRLR